MHLEPLPPGPSVRELARVCARDARGCGTLILRDRRRSPRDGDPLAPMLDAIYRARRAALRLELRETLRALRLFSRP